MARKCTDPAHFFDKLTAAGKKNRKAKLALMRKLIINMGPVEIRIKFRRKRVSNWKNFYCGLKLSIKSQDRRFYVANRKSHLKWTRLRYSANYFCL